MRLSSIGIFIALLAIPATSTASDWRRAAAGSDSDSFVDRDSIVRTGDRVQFWREIRYYEVQVNEANGDRFDTIAILMRANCDEQSFQNMRVVVRLNGEHVYSYNPSQEVEYAEPDTVAAGILRAACLDDWPT